MRSPRSLSILVILGCISIALVSGCAAYRFGSASLFRPGIRTVHVPVVRNDTFRHDLGVRLTEAIVREIEISNTLQSHQRSKCGQSLGMPGGERNEKGAD